MKKDSVIFDLIEKEHQRQLKGIELIASENFVSEQVMQAMGSCMTNKYAEGYPGKRYYGGCEVVDQSEQIAIDRIKQLYGAEWANVQPHSGAQANMAVLLACLEAGDTFMGLNLEHGGHLSHGSLVNSSGILYRPIGYNLSEETGMVDYDHMEKMAIEHKPKLIIGGGSAYSREWDYKRMREIADKVGALLMIDMAHPAGLIAAGLLENPVKYAHIVTSTTHKTLRGPRGGLILSSCGDEELYKRLQSSVFPANQGGPLVHIIAAKAVCFKEALEPAYKEYQANVIKNAKAMVEVFKQRGYDVVSNGTENHLFLVSFIKQGLTGKAADAALGKANITVNKNSVPNDPQKPFVTSGIRVGTPAVTRRGFNEQDCRELAGWMCDVLDALGKENEEQVIAATKEKVLAICKRLPVYAS